MALAVDTPASPSSKQLDLFDSDEEMQFRGHTYADIKAAVLAPHIDGHRKAAANMGDIHRDMERHEQLFAGIWTTDLTTESAVLNGIYVPKLAEFIEFCIAAEMQQFMPDPQSMDFVTVTARWPGMEEDARRSEAAYRQKLRIMKPPGSNSLYEEVIRLKTNHRVLGNLVGIVTHEFYAGDIDGDQDTVSEGPVVENISPRNWFPWSQTVDNVRQCAHTIRSFLSEDDASRLSYVDVEKLRSKHQPREIDRTQGGAIGDSADSVITSGLTARGPSDLGWERMIYFGPLLWRQIAEGLNEEEWTRDDVVDAMVAVFGQDGVPVTDGHWWTCEWLDGDYVTMCLPYGPALPDNDCPLVHEPFHKVNGRLVGLGVYDRMGWIERLWNEYNRLMLLHGRNSAEPPVVCNPDLIEEDWLASHVGEETFVSPGEMIMLRRGIGALPPGTSEPLHVLEMGLPATMANMRVEMDRLESLMRAEAQTTSDYSGASSARTATQAQNNLIQSRTMGDFQVKLAENGWFLDILKRCYVLMRQVIQARGETLTVPMSDDEKNLAVYAVAPEAIRDLTYYSIGVTGSSSPNNRIYLVQQFTQLLTVMIPISGQIGADLRWFVLRILDYLQVRDKEGAFIDHGNLQAVLANVTALIGQNGVQSLPPELQMQIQGLLQAAATTMLPNPQGTFEAAPPSSNNAGGNASGNTMGNTSGGMRGMTPPRRVPGLANAPGLPSMNLHPSGMAVGMTGVA